MGEIDSLREILGYTRTFRHYLERRRDKQLQQELFARENALQVAPFGPPLAVGQVFAFPNFFSFGMPVGFGEPDPSLRAQWEQGFDSSPLVAAVDRTVSEVTCFFAVFSGPSEYEISPTDLAGHSLWLFEVLGDEYRERARQLGPAAIVAGPKAIYVGGERGIWSVSSQIEGGIENHKWVVQVIRNGRAFSIMMFVLPTAEARYADSYWTAIGSWRWA